MTWKSALNYSPPLPEIMANSEDRMSHKVSINGKELEAFNQARAV